MAVDGAPAKGGNLGQDFLVTVDDAGEVHDLGQSMCRCFAQQTGQVAGTQGGAVGLHGRGRHA